MPGRLAKYYSAVLPSCAYLLCLNIFVTSVTKFELFELHADTKNGSARSSSQIQINVALREVWHSTQSTIMSDPDQNFSLACRDKVVYWHPQWIQISGPKWSPPKLRPFDAEILRLCTNGGLPLDRWPCMICVREIMMIRRDDSGRVVLLTTVFSIERSSVRKMPLSFSKTSISFNNGR